MNTTPIHWGPAMHRSHLAITTLAILLATATPQSTHAQIVSDVSGVIDLRLNPFYDTAIVWSEEEGKNIVVPDDGLHEIVPVGFSNISASIDGNGSFSSHGLSAIDYGYQPINPAKAQFNFLATAQTQDDPDGGGGSSAIDINLTIAAPFRYRFEADAIDVFTAYRVAFNGVSAEAKYSQTHRITGTFPVIFVDDDPSPRDWDTYVDEGILPAGTYNLSLSTYSSFSRSFIPLNSKGSATLLIQLLGDTDLDGTVGTQDLNNVLNTWNQTTPAGNPLIGDLNNDGFIGIADLNQVLAAWNADVRPPQPVAVNVPEPTTIALLTTLLLTLSTRTTLRPRQN